MLVLFKRATPLCIKDSSNLSIERKLTQLSYLRQISCKSVATLIQLKVILKLTIAKKQLLPVELQVVALGNHKILRVQPTKAANLK